MGNSSKVIYVVAKKLKESYKDFSHHNRKNPLSELLFILCSTKTPEKSYLATYRALRNKFPRVSMFLKASVEEIAEPLAGGGLQNVKAQTIKNTLALINERFGRPTLAPLRNMNDQQCEEFLTSLPRIGKKIARCVMMYSLGRQVFPVDTHCWRISKRLGWIEPSLKDGTCTQKDMDRLQDLIPPELRFSLHVNMVSLGREICTVRDPKCYRCPINNLCPRVGLDRAEKTPVGES